MPDNLIGFSGLMLEDDIIKKLISDHFDGVMLLECATGKIVYINDWMGGSLQRLVDPGGTPHDAVVEKLTEKMVPRDSRRALKKELCLASVIDNLNRKDTYNVDFHTCQTVAGNDDYKRISFEYLDKDKKYILLSCENISSILVSDIDPLTGLYNSSGFHKHVKEWIENHPGKKYRIQRYDVDRFKDVNGLYGYEVGNRLLKHMGEHMRQLDSPETFSAHLNADHFVRFCSGDALSVNDYFDAFNKCFKEYDLKIPITMHMGVYDLCEPDCDSFTMSYKALLALQSIKGNFSRKIAYYEKGMMQLEYERQELLKDMERALENDEFEVWFQPQVDYARKQLIGAEALARWRHPQKGLISPGMFIPLLERSDYIGAVDEYIIDKTCGFVRRWMDKEPDKNIIASVNLSRNDILKSGICDTMKSIVKGNGLPPRCIRFEVTESSYMENSERLISTIKEFKEAGFIIEMDDFGSGYSSLNTLKDIDIDILKLDVRFLSGTENREKSKIIISAVINMASALGLPVIAEGVETKEQADMLLSFGCKYMQGYYFSRPVPAAEYEKMLHDTDWIKQL